MLNKKNFLTSFHLLDVDGDGALNQEEFMLQSLIREYKVPPEKIDAMK